MTPTETAYFIADGDVTASPDETIAFHSDGSEANYTYSSAWFDGDQPAAEARPCRYPAAAGPAGPVAGEAAQSTEIRCAATAHAARHLPQRAGQQVHVRPIGELWYRKSGTYRAGAEPGRSSTTRSDMFGEWNRAYGPAGFLQYQFVVPTEAVDEFKAIIVDIQRSGTTVLNVFKLFRPRQPGAAELPIPAGTSAWTSRSRLA